MALTASKKFWIGILGMIAVFATAIPQLGLDAAVASEIRAYFAGIVGMMIAGQAVTDLASKGKTSGNAK